MENIDIFCYDDDILMNPNGTPRTPGKDVEHLILTPKSNKKQIQSKGAEAENPAIFKKPVDAAPKNITTCKKPTNESEITSTSSKITQNKETEADKLAKKVGNLNVNSSTKVTKTYSKQTRHSKKSPTSESVRSKSSGAITESTHKSKANDRHSKKSPSLKTSRNSSTVASPSAVTNRPCTDINIAVDIPNAWKTNTGSFDIPSVSDNKFDPFNISTFIKQEPLSPMDRDEEMPLAFHSFSGAVKQEPIDEIKQEPIDEIKDEPIKEIKQEPNLSGFDDSNILFDVTNVKTELFSPDREAPMKAIKQEMVAEDEKVPGEKTDTKIKVRENKGVLASVKHNPKPSTSKSSERGVRKERNKKSERSRYAGRKESSQVLSPKTDERVREEAIKSVVSEEPRSKFLRSIAMGGGKIVKATFIGPRGVRFPDEVNTKEIEEYHDNYQFYLARKMAMLKKNELEKRAK